MTINKKICPAGLKNNPNRPLKSVSYITIHTTGNYVPAANAKAHANFQYNGSGGNQTSWHYSADDKEIWQSFEDMQECWHAGDGNDGPGNYTSVGIEICVNDKSAFKLACNNAAWLAAVLLKRHNLPIDRVVQHNKWSGKNCPAELRSGAWGLDWNGFISENTKWGIQKRFEKGELINWNFMFGYRIKNGAVEIEPEEAAIVKMIFEDFISGNGYLTIARKLNDMSVTGIFGAVWTKKAVARILANEKYSGDALLNKRCKLDHLSPIQKNRGLINQYYVEQSHPAIIDAETYKQYLELVDANKKRYGEDRENHGVHLFSGKLRCGHCGTRYTRVHHHYINWKCQVAMKKGKAACPAKRTRESILYSITQEVLGIDQLSREIWETHLKEIVIPAHGCIIFVFLDGREVTKMFANDNRGTKSE